MADQLDPDAIRARTFTAARRGFERDEVAAFQEEVAELVADLRAQLDSVEARLAQLGITDLPDLKREFDTVGQDVSDILQAARDAAEDMRERASADAATRHEGAAEQAEALRRDAWESSAKMLEDVTAKAEEMAAQAQEDTLFVRAEAEREALRMTGDAKRDTEELLRSARADADRIITEARSEADRIASESAEAQALATERVGALEARREELMGELDEVRGTITEIEEAAAKAKPDIGDWLDEDATVRIVPGPQLPPRMPLDPVDADDLVAEVESLRVAPPVTADEPPSAVVSSAAVNSDSADSEPPDSAAEAEAAPPEAEPEPVAAAIEPSAPEGAEDGSDDLDDLFASLRDPAAPAVEPPASPHQEAEQPVAAPASTLEPQPSAVAVADRGDEAARDLRDRLIVPITNDVLRGVKRQIVDVQNAVLEELRTEADDWRPKKAMFDSIIIPEARGVAAQAFAAGVVAAGEMTGRPAPTVPDQSTHDLASFVTDLWAAAVDAIDGAAGGGSRERGASVGRVFRTWRTDEAERRVRQLAHAEYNAGVAAALAVLGISARVDPPGRDVADPDAAVIPVS